MNYPKLQELLPDGQIYENTHMNTLEAFLPPEASTRPTAPDCWRRRTAT